MQSDFTLDPALFAPAEISEDTKRHNDNVRKNDEINRQFYYRDVLDIVGLRARKPAAGTVSGEFVQIESREPGRTIPCIVVRPRNQQASGIFLHFHGGGLASGTHDGNKPLLQRFADASGCITLSAGYRLSPEHLFPGPVQDCFDVADYLLKHGQEDFGGPLRFLGGESAGAYLSIQTYLHIAGTNPEVDTLKGLVLTYGVYSYSYLPTAYTLQDTPCLNGYKMTQFSNIVFPKDSAEVSQMLTSFDSEFGQLAETDSKYDHVMKHPAVSPLFRRLDKITGPLPRALFLCGTLDPLLDDTILMSAHWQMAGGPAVTKFVTGAPHGFVEAPVESADCCTKAAEFIRQFIEESR